MTFIIAATVVVICRAGKAALIGTALLRTAGFLTGASLMTTALMATIGGILFLATRSFVRMRRDNKEIEGGVIIVNDKLLKTGLVGTVIAALCCFTPVLVVLFGVAGLSAVVCYLDYVLFPALAVFVLITIYAVIRRARKT